MKRLLTITPSALICLAILPPALTASMPITQSDSAAEVLRLINQLRASRGLTPYRYNSALAAAAQAHTEWQVAMGVSSHSGAGGSSPRDRATAAGYGDSMEVYVVENVGDGTELTPAQIVWWWQQDWVHLDAMISRNYRDAGVGYVQSGRQRYYTLDVGRVGSAPRRPAASDDEDAPEPAVPAARPVRRATARPDGAIVHVVESGQALWTIAAVYGVELSELLALNGLSESEGEAIFVGQDIVVRPAATSAASQTPASTATPAATQTPTATATFTLGTAATQTQTPIPMPTATPRPAVAGRSPGAFVAHAALIAGLGLLGLAGVVALVGLALERRRR